MSFPPQLEPTSSFIERFVVGIGGCRSDNAFKGTGVLLGPCVVATCRHVIMQVNDSEILVGNRSGSSRARTVVWPEHDDDEHAIEHDDGADDVAFVLLAEPLGSAAWRYPALVEELTGELLAALDQWLPEGGANLMSCGYLPGGPMRTPATIDYGAYTDGELVDHVRLDQSHRGGESGGPVWLVPPARLVRRAQDWRPGLVLGLLAEGGKRAPKSFFITSNALLELRAQGHEHQELLDIRVVHAKDVESWLPLLSGGPITRVFERGTGQWTSPSLRTTHLRLPLGSVRLTSYTGTVVEHRVWGSQGSERGYGTTRVSMELFLRLDDGREIHLTSSQKDYDIFPFSPNHMATNPLRSGHRVTLIWATNGAGRRGMVAACHVYTMQKRVAYAPRYVRFALVGPIAMSLWVGAIFVASIALDLLYSMFYGNLVLLVMFIHSTLETRAVRQAIDALMQAAEIDVVE